METPLSLHAATFGVLRSSFLLLLLLAGEAEQAGLPQPVPLQRVLRLRQAEGAGVQEHRVDRRVHRPAAPRQDRQLHPHLLRLRLLPPHVIVVLERRLRSPLDVSHSDCLMLNLVHSFAGWCKLFSRHQEMNIINNKEYTHMQVPQNTKGRFNRFNSSVRTLLCNYTGCMVNVHCHSFCNTAVGD